MKFDDWLEKQTGLHALASAKADAPKKMTDDELVFRDLEGNVWRKGVYFRCKNDSERNASIWEVLEVVSVEETCACLKYRLVMYGADLKDERRVPVWHIPNYNTLYYVAPYEETKKIIDEAKARNGKNP